MDTLVVMIWYICIHIYTCFDFLLLPWKLTRINCFIFKCHDTFHSHLGCHTSESRRRPARQGGTPCDVSSPQRQSPSAVTEMGGGVRLQTATQCAAVRWQHPPPPLTCLKYAFSELRGQALSPALPETRKRVSQGESLQGGSLVAGDPFLLPRRQRGSERWRLQQVKGWTARNPPPRLSSSSA